MLSILKLRVIFGEIMKINVFKALWRIFVNCIGNIVFIDVHIKFMQSGLTKAIVKGEIANGQLKCQNRCCF
jgi:hypothetical protein